MRVLFGIILGVMLTFGIAYIYDLRNAPVETIGASHTLAQRNMVNWNVVSQLERMRCGFTRPGWAYPIAPAQACSGDISD